MTLNPADIAAAASLVMMTSMALKGGQMAGEIKRGLQAVADSSERGLLVVTNAVKVVADDLRDFKRETTEQFGIIADKHLEFSVALERTSLLQTALEQRVTKGGL